MLRLKCPAPVFWGVFLLAFCVSSQLRPVSGMSDALASAVETELRAHVKNMELRAAEMHHRHTRSIEEIREEVHLRAKRSFELSDIRHGFIPGTGVGNRETAEFEDILPFPSGHLEDAPIEAWENFHIGRKTFVVASLPQLGRVEIYEFSTTELEPLIPVYVYDIEAQILKTFTQYYYSNGRRTKETKILLVAHNETVLLVANDDGSCYQVKNVSVNPTNVTAVDFFSIGLDSYLVFSRDLDEYDVGEKSVIYLWSATNQIFDIRQEIQTYGARFVQAFEISGNTYLLTAERYNASSIWRYNIRQGQFRKYQSLSTARHGLFYTDAYESYIILISADVDVSYLFHWSAFYFYREQVLSTVNASSWAIVVEPTICQDAPLLILSSGLAWPQSLSIYKTVKTLLVRQEHSVGHRLRDYEVHGIRSLMQFVDFTERTFVTFVLDVTLRPGDPPEVTSFLFELELLPVPVTSPYAVAAQTAFVNTFEHVEHILDRYNSSVNNMADIFRDSLKITDGELDLPGGFIFNGTIIFNGTLEIVEVIAETVIVDNTVDGVNLTDIFNDLEEEADANEVDVLALLAQFDDRVSLSGEDTITGHKVFKSLTIEGELLAQTITSDSINGVDVTPLPGVVVRNNVDDQTLTGSLTFSNTLETSADIILSDGVLVNGFDMSQAVTESGAQTITGAKTFSQNVDVGGNAVFQPDVTLNTVDVSDEVVTLAGTHQLDGSITFTSPLTVSGDITTSSTVDTIDVSALDADTVREGGGKTVTGSVTFNVPVTVEGDVAIGGTANTIDLADLDARAVRHNVDATISGAKTFSGSVTIGGALVAGGQVDGVSVFIDSVRRNFSDESWNHKLPPSTRGILLPYGFSEGDLIFEKGDDTSTLVILQQTFLFFSQPYDSLYINSNGLISFNGPVTTFVPNPFPTSGDAIISPYWADIDIRDGGDIYWRQVTRSSEDEPLFRAVDTIICRGIRDQYSSTWAMVITWYQVSFYSSYGRPERNTFQAILSTDGDVSYAIFNYADIQWPYPGSSMLAQVGFNAGDGMVYHTIEASFTPDIINVEETTNVNVLGRWLFQTNDYSIDDLQTKSQTITGTKTFSQCLKVAGAMDVDGTVDGINLANAVTLTGTRSITGKKTFTNGIEVERDLHTTGTVDGVDVSALAPNVMTLSGSSQTVAGDVTFNTPVIATKNFNVVGDINGVDIVALEADAIYGDTVDAQTITAAKTFTDAVTVTSPGHVTFSGLVNMHDPEDDFLDNHSAQTVTGSKTFSSGFTASADLTVDGTVDGVTVATLWNEVALTSRAETIGGNKAFAGDMSVTGALTVGVDTNGIDLSEDVMMVNKAQTVTGDKTFTQVKVTGNVQALGGDVINLNGVDWTYFVDNRITLSTDQGVTGAVTMSDDLTVGGNIVQDDLVNGLHLPTLAASILYKTGNQVVSGSNTFTGGSVFSGPVTLDATLDGVNIDDMTSRAIYLANPQTIAAVKTFKNDLTIMNDLTLTEVNSVDLADLNGDIVWTNAGSQTIAGKKTFEDGFSASQNIEVSGTVNGMDLSEEVLTLIDAQTITGAYTFNDDVTIDEDLTVSGDINGVDIAAVDAVAMRIDEVQMVTSYIIFNNDVEVDGDITILDSVTVDNVDLSALGTIAKYRDVPFSLPNSVTFNLPVTFSGDLDVSGTVHGIDFQALVSNVMTKDTSQTITGAHNIVGTVDGEDISVQTSMTAETAYGININDFVADVVRLRGDQTITGSKTFTQDLTVEGSISITGTVDGIDISEIVTLNEEQFISAAKTFDSCDVQTADEIFVTGTVNDIDIAGAEYDTLYLSNPRKVEGQKTFTEDISIGGDLQVDGLVDGKDITQGFTLNTTQTVTAYHMFNSKASVTGDVSVGGLVNTVDLANIDQKRVTLSGSHTIEGALTFNAHSTFEDDVTTAYLFDGVDLSELATTEETRYAEYEDSLYLLACYAESQCERTESLAEVVDNFIDAIDYIEEVQVLEEHVRRFEPLTIDGVTFLAAAVYADEHGDVCTTSVIYKWDNETGDFQEFQRINTNGAVLWKHFTIGGIVCLIVANSGHTPCHDTPSGNAIYRYDTDTFTFVGTVGEDQAATSDIAAFTVDEKNFVVFTTIDGSIAMVYEYNENSQEFEVYQDIETGVTASVEHVIIDDGIFLVFTLYLLERSSIYQYNTTDEQFYFYQKIESEHAREVTSFHDNNIDGFALADHISVTDIDATFEVQVRVFIWDKVSERFDLNYTVPVVKPGDVEVFTEGNFLYMVVVQDYNFVDIYRYEGAAGFVKFYSMPHHGARAVAIFTLQDGEYETTPGYDFGQFFMAVAVDPFPTANIYSRLLKVVNIGGSVQINTWDEMCDSGLRETTRIDTPPPTC